jgi:hypothetical protein
MTRRLVPLWPALCGGVACVGLFGGIGVGLSGAMRVDYEAAEPQTPVERAMGVLRRCAHCGWIEAKREMPRGAADPHAAAVYEYTVRMTDGSSSVFQQALPASWRVGERLTVN